MGSPFAVRPPRAQGLLGRLFGRVDRDALLAEVEAALARAGDWAAVTREQVQAIEARFGGALKDVGANEALGLVQAAADSLDDAAMAAGGASRLRSLAEALDLAEPAEGLILRRAGLAIAEAARAAASDGVVTEDERAAYDGLVARMGIEPALAEGVMAEAATEVMRGALAEATQDGRLSDEEMARLDALAAGLKTRLALDAETEALVTRARKLWQAEAGPLPVLDAPIRLFKSEACRYAATGEALEPRTRGKTDYWHSFGHGDVVLTDKRVLFNGGSKNFAIQIARIVDHRADPGGIEIRRAAGKPLTLKLDARDETFPLLVARVLGGR